MMKVLATRATYITLVYSNHCSAETALHGDSQKLLRP